MNEATTLIWDKEQGCLYDKDAEDNEVPLSNKSDWVSNVMRDHPGLTREKAEEMAEAFGF